jgi:cytochrome c556
MRKTVLLAGFTLVAAVPAALSQAPAPAADPAAAVEKRQATMKQQGQALAAIKKFTDGSGSREDAQRAATQLVATARSVPTLFPAGTSSADLPGKTRAKPAIWTDRAKFEQTAQGLAPQAEKLLAAVETGDAAATAQQFQALGRVCGACHETFREPER